MRRFAIRGLFAFVLFVKFPQLLLSCPSLLLIAPADAQIHNRKEDGEQDNQSASNAIPSGTKANGCRRKRGHNRINNPKGARYRIDKSRENKQPDASSHADSRCTRIHCLEAIEAGTPAACPPPIPAGKIIPPGSSGGRACAACHATVTTVDGIWTERFTDARLVEWLRAACRPPHVCACL